MNRIDDKNLDLILGGGTSITGTLVSAITDIIKVLYEAGHSVGSSIRRFKEKDLCPLSD